MLRVLAADDFDREARCVTEASLAQLRARGLASGLRAFLEEVKEHVVPLRGAERKSVYDHLVGDDL